MLEIERKFLVKSEAYKEASLSKERILQGFLNTHPERTVRVRVVGDFGYLTVKGKSNQSGTTRFEWECEIAVDAAMGLLQICEEGVIEKTRFLVVFGG